MTKALDSNGTGLTGEAILVGVGSERSLSSRIYHDLRQRIINGELPIGTRLRERELAEMLGVSRVPLREALPQLEADGFIYTTLRRGAVVAQLTLRDVRELFDVRLGVEVYATRLAAINAAAGASTASLQNALDRAIVAVGTHNPDLISEVNADLHEQIIALADNILLTNMMKPVAARDRWIFRLTADRDVHVACHEHVELCSAITTGNADMAAALAYSHIERGRAPTLEALRTILPPE